MDATMEKREWLAWLGKLVGTLQVAALPPLLDEQG